MEQQKKQIAIELSPEAADGVFANLTIITHSPSEFILTLRGCCRACRRPRSTRG